MRARHVTSPALTAPEEFSDGLLSLTGDERQAVEAEAHQDPQPEPTDTDADWRSLVIDGDERQAIVTIEDDYAVCLSVLLER